MANSIVRVGGANALDPTTGLPMFRQYFTFEANQRDNYIRVYYDQWLESPIGNRIEIQPNRHYIVIDQPAITHIEYGDPEAIPPTEDVIVEDVPAYPMFTGWNQKIIVQGWVGARLGADIIDGAINNTLLNMAFDAQDGHKVKPA